MRAVLGGGLRAGTGAAVLTLLYGRVGYRFQLRDLTLDSSGRGDWGGTSGKVWARAGVDLALLYGTMVLCPYALVPTILVNSLQSRS
ncbi:unnamed protein product [Discosporangium mesarthrocarpum]